jgi:AcrR family transcriptional regulator
VEAKGDEPAPGVVRLPPGRHGLSRDAVSESQRERLLNGVVEAVGEHGYNATTIAQLVEAAQVSRRTFYEHFAGKEDCFLAAYEVIAEHLQGALREAASEQTTWPDRVRAMLATLLGIFAADPTLTRFLLVESLAAGGEVAARHRASLRCLAALLRPEAPASDDALAEAREQALVGGIATLVVRRLKAGEAGRLEDLLPDLHELVLTSYLGRGEAQRLAREAAA